MSKCLLILSCISVLFTGNVCAQEPRAGQFSIEPYKFKAYDGRETAAEFGRLWVREKRHGKSTRLIQLAFVRLKSTAATPGSPIVFLAGGPGIPGIGMGQVPVYFNLWSRLREVGDVILLDQRGTGMSSPNLQCSPSTLPNDVFETAAKSLDAYTMIVKKCADDWRSKGTNLTAYNSDESSDDLEDLRIALGLSQLSLLAHSYGTELALSAIRRHGDRLDRVVLASTRGPDNLLKFPSVWDLQIKKISGLATADPSVGKSVPDLESLMRRVFDKLEKNPVTLTVTDRKSNSLVILSVGKIGLQTLVRGDVGDTRAFARLPALLYTIDQGDYSIFARRMEQLYNGFGASAMQFSIDCAAGWSKKRLAATNKEAQTALMSNVNMQWNPDICKLANAGNLGSKFRAKVRSEVKTLFISGTLDPNSPASQANEIRNGFVNGHNLIVENAGHESLPAKEVQDVILDFLRGQDINQRTVYLPRPSFISVEDAKLPPSTRGDLLLPMRKVKENG